MIFKILTEKEFSQITKESHKASQHSDFDLETFYESKRAIWQVPESYKIIGIDAYGRLFVKKTKIK